MIVKGFKVVDGDPENPGPDILDKIYEFQKTAETKTITHEQQVDLHDVTAAVGRMAGTTPAPPKWNLQVDQKCVKIQKDLAVGDTVLFRNPYQTYDDDKNTERDKKSSCARAMTEHEGSYPGLFKEELVVEELKARNSKDFQNTSGGRALFQAMAGTMRPDDLVAKVRVKGVDNEAAVMQVNLACLVEKDEWGNATAERHAVGRAVGWDGNGLAYLVSDRFQTSVRTDQCQTSVIVGSAQSMSQSLSCPIHSSIPMPHQCHVGCTEVSCLMHSPLPEVHSLDRNSGQRSESSGSILLRNQSPVDV